MHACMNYSRKTFIGVRKNGPMFGLVRTWNALLNMSDFYKVLEIALCSN